jgi:hypothetical protein
MCAGHLASSKAFRIDDRHPIGAIHVPIGLAKDRAIAPVGYSGARSLNAECDIAVKPRMMTNAFHVSGVPR